MPANTLSPDAMALTVEQQRELIDTLVADNLLAPSLGKRWLAALREQAAEIARLTGVQKVSEAMLADATTAMMRRDQLILTLTAERDALARENADIHRWFKDRGLTCAESVVAQLQERNVALARDAERLRRECDITLHTHYRNVSDFKAAIRRALSDAARSAAPTTEGTKDA